MGDADGFSFGFGSGNFCFSGSCLGTGVLLGFLSCGDGGVNIHKKNETLNITYNRVGDRISAVGFQGYPNIFENSRDVLDITLLHKLNKGEIKLAIGDVLAQPSIYYQKLQNRNLIKTSLSLFITQDAAILSRLIPCALKVSLLVLAHSLARLQT